MGGSRRYCARSGCLARVIMGHDQLTSMGPSKTRALGPLKHSLLRRRRACIDLRSKAYRVPPVAAPST